MNTPSSDQEKKRLRFKAYYANNAERLKEYHRLRYQNDPEPYMKRASDRIKKCRAFILEYKKKCCCANCGNPDFRVLEFHHIDPSEKDINLSAVAKHKWGNERILEELNKCLPLCANCHRILHWSERNDERE